MSKLFIDKALQAKFQEEGYVVMDVFDAAEIRQLQSVYDQYIDPEKVTGLYESSRNNTAEVNHIINQILFERFEPFCQKVFTNFRLYGGTFMVKSHRNTEVLPLHQDWSIVDETKYDTFFIWCPLTSVSASNGGMFVLEGSHTFFNTLRSGSYPSNRYLLPPTLHPFTKNIELAPGQALIYSDRLFHGSHANNTSNDRIVATARIMDADAPLVYFHKADEQHADVYEGTPDFYMNQINRIAKGEKPIGVKKLYSQKYTHTPVTDEALQEKIQTRFGQAPSNIIRCNIFKDTDMQLAFEKDGYVVIDLIDKKKATALQTFYDGLNATLPGQGFKVSLDHENTEFVQRVTEKLKDTVHEEVSNYFKDHQIFTASFVVKEQNPMGVVPPHQDWTFVDENEYWSATIWCPLLDVNMDNGGLGVLKGSHTFYDHVRPSPSPQFSPPFHDAVFDIFPYLDIINLKAGQALVFNNKTIHGSPPNVSGPTRVAFGIGITHKEAKIRHYYLIPNASRPSTEAYEVDDHFFNRYNNARLKAMYERSEKPVDLNSIGLFSLAPKQFKTSELIQMIESAGNVKNLPLMHKMADLFGYNLDGTKKASPAQEHGSNRAKLPFWKVYTPINILREIQFRLSKI